MILVDAEGLSAHRPGRALFDDLSITIQTGDRIGLVGINGTGKSTLLRALAGLEQSEAGVVRVGRGVRIAMLGQQPSLSGTIVTDAIGTGWEAESILERVGMARFANEPIATLSGGQAKRVALARTLLTPADLLLLDEPTNHLDIDAIAWLEGWLARFTGGLVVVTHDRHLLDRVTTRMVELDRGSAFVHQGGYASYLEARDERETRSATAQAVRRNLARAELAWLRRGAPARSRKPKARIDAANALLDKAPPPSARAGALDLAAASPVLPTPRLGDKVIECRDVGHRFGDGPWLWEHLELALAPRGRLGVLGANGTGKTTLLDLLAGRLDPAAGTIERGPTAVVGYADQVGRELDPTQRVRNAVVGPARQPDWQDAALMERFWFDGDAQHAPISTLSGGERRRLQLLLVLAERPNVLLLDEPTNDLDLDSLRALEDYLDNWPGSLVVVSHDRAFLQRTVEEVIALDLPGGVGGVPGGYAGWQRMREAQRPSRPVASAAGVPAPAKPAPTKTAPGRQPPPGGQPSAAGRQPSASRPAKDASKVRTPSTLRRLLGIADRDLEEATATRDVLQLRLSEVGSDHVALAAVATDLAAAEERLAAIEARWMELAEELGG